MKKQLLMFLIIFLSFFVVIPNTYADESKPLGNSNFALKAGQIRFLFNKDLKDMRLDEGTYYGFEDYSNISPNAYIGAEAAFMDLKVSYVDSGVYINQKLDFIPIELNLKLVSQFASNLTLGFGAGASYNLARFQGNAAAPGIATLSRDFSDWLWGGQVFADLNYAAGGFFMGIEGKYQITEKLKDMTSDPTYGDITFEEDFTNWRVGGKVGIMW